VIIGANAHRVQGLLWSAIEAGAISATEELARDARDQYVAALRGCLAVEEIAVLALDALGDAGVSVRVLKGLAVAHLDHDDPAERLFGDADLLVRPSQHQRALAALTSAGFCRDEPPVRDWWERRFGKAVVLRSQSGGELDLHLRLTGGYFGELIDHDRLWRSPGEPFSLAGRPAEALDREARLFHACLHAVLGGESGLRTLHDVAHLVLVRGADWRVTVERAALDGTDVVVAEALRAAWSELSLDPQHPSVTWATRHEPTRGQAAALAAYRAAIGGHGWTPEGRSILPALGRIDQARFLLGLALPSSVSLRARDRSWTRHIRRGRAAMRRPTSEGHPR
jgi:hypothetical protein